MKLWVTGYLAHELNLFNYQDERAQWLQRFLTCRLQEQIENGYDWFLFKGQLGVEYLAFRALLELRTEYPEIKIAVFFPYLQYGENWSEKNQLLLNEYKEKADYVATVSQHSYQNKEQFIQQENFLFQHSEGFFCIYDDEVKGVVQYTLRRARQYQEQVDNYSLFIYSLYDIDEFIREQMVDEWVE